MSAPNIVIGKFLRETFLAKNMQHFAPNGDNTANIVQAQAERELIARVQSGISTNQVRQGYREGVLLVKINPQGFKRRIKELQPGDYLFGQMKSRVEGEAPRKKTGVLHVGELPEAKFVDAVLYHRDVLREDGDQVTDDVDYEIVTFLAKDIDEDEPMDPDTLIANHFGFDGGTNTRMSPEEFEETLRRSCEYWRTRAHIF